MTVEHFEQLLERLLRNSPFHPFTVELYNGERFEVDHPLAVSYRDGFAVYIAPGSIPYWFDHESVSHVAEDIANGSKRREDAN